MVYCKVFIIFSCVLKTRNLPSCLNGARFPTLSLISTPTNTVKTRLLLWRINPVSHRCPDWFGRPYFLFRSELTELQATTKMDSAQDVANSDKETRRKHLGEEDANKTATLTDLFNGVAKDTPAIIIPEGDERSVSYTQLYEDVTNFERDLAGQ